MVDKSKIIEQLEEALGVRPEDISNLPAKIENNQHADDYEYTKQTQKDLFNVGFKSLSEVTDLAKETSDVKYFEVVASLLKSMKDISSGIMEAAKTKSEIDLINSKLGLQKENVINGNLTQTNQTIFVGSPNDLSKFIEQNNANLDTIEQVIVENAKKC